MDENNPGLNSVERSAEEALREVVLRYEAPHPQSVELRYVQPTPLPGRSEEQEPSEKERSGYTYEAWAQTAPAERPPRSRRGLKIFLGCIAVLLVISLVMGFFPRGNVATRRDEGEYSFRYELRPDNTGSGKTSIRRWKNGDGTRLRFSETHGEALTIQEVYERVNPCTVTVATGFSDGSAVVGTGVIFTEDGYILTNAHVVAGGNKCFVVLDTGRMFDDVRLVGYDEAKDLAVIKVKGEGLPVAEFGDSDALTVGDTVYAIGNPLGVELRGTLTDGIVSAINRDVTVDGIRMTLIQTNAALNNGNSGGPLINTYGQVVGINTMKMGSSSTVSVEGLGFAIPVSSSAWMVDDLIEYGEVRGEPTLGILVAAETLPSGEGAILIHEVTADSAADKAGLRAGDYIVRADGEALETTNDLLRIRRRYRAGEALTLEIDRTGERFTAAAVLEEAYD